MVDRHQFWGSDGRLVTSIYLFSKKMSGLLILLATGFDVVLLGNFYAYPEFTKTFGVLQPDGTYQVPAPWQAGLGNASACGSIIGLLVCFLVKRLQFAADIIILVERSQYTGVPCVAQADVGSSVVSR